MASASSAAAVNIIAPDTGPKRMKGIGFVNVRQYVLEKHGADAWPKVLAKLKPEDSKTVESIVAVGWYDTYLFARLLRVVDSTLGHGDLGLLKDVGRYDAECDYNRVLRLLLRVISPSSIFTGHARLWRHFQDKGDWNFKHGKLNTAGTLSGWAVDAALCVELAGYLERMVEFTGGKNVSLGHTVCRATGSAECVFNFRWT